MNSGGLPAFRLYGERPRSIVELRPFGYFFPRQVCTDRNPS